MLDTTTSSQGSKATLAAGAGLGVPSPELETVPLPTPPYVTRLSPPAPRRCRPGATLASPMVVLSRGWLRRHRPTVVITAAVLGVAVFIVLLAALAYHVTPSTVSEDYEVDIEEPENVEVPLEQHVIEDELDTSRPLILDASGSVVEHPGPKDVEESQARDADGGVLVARWEEERPAEVGAVLRDAVKSSRSPSRSRRHRTDDSSIAERPPLQRFADRQRIPQSIYLMRSPYFSRGGLDVASAHRANERPLVDAGPNVIQDEVSSGEEGNSLRQWAALPFDQRYDVELDEIGNSVSETIKQASGTEKPAEYAREYSLGSDPRYQSKASNIESNSLESGIFQRETLQDPEESVVHTLSKWPVNHRLGQQDRLVTVIKFPGIRRQKRSASPEADVHGLHLTKRPRKRNGLLGSLSQENGEKSPLNVGSSVDGDGGFDRRTPFRGKRQVYWGPFYDPNNRFPIRTESKEDSSSEEESSKDENLVISPYHWYYTPQRAAAQPQVYLPYGDPALQYWPSYPPHAPYYRSEARVAQPDFYRARSFQDIASTQQLSRQYEGTGGDVSAPVETVPQSRQMEKALETSVVAPMNISPDLFARAMQSETPTEFSKHLQELSETHVSNLEAGPQSRQMENTFETSVVAPMNISPELFARAMQSKTPAEFSKHMQQILETHESNLRQALHDNGRRLEAFTVLSVPDDDTGKHPESDSLIAESSAEASMASEEERSAEDGPQYQPARPCQPKESGSGESSSEEDTPGRAAEPGLDKLFTADGIVRLVSILPSETIKKIIESLSTEALADLLKGLSKAEIAKIKNSLPPEKLEAIKKMFSPEELEDVKGKLGIKSNVTSAPANGQQVVEIPKRFGGPTATTTVSSTTGSGAESAVMAGGLGQRQVEDEGMESSPEVGASQVRDDSSEEASEEDYSDGGAGASSYAPLTAVPETSTDAAQTAPEQLQEEAQPGEVARSFLRGNGSGSLLQRRLRPGLLQQAVAAMGSPVASAGMAQMAAQDQRLGRDMDQGNPLDAALAATAQRELRADPSDVILSTLTALAEDVHWIRMLLAESNVTRVGAARSSLMDAELEWARRKFVQHSAVSGSGLSDRDRERLAALPPGLADQISARAAGKAVAADFPTGLGGDYTGAVEATASTAYTVSSPGLDATTPQTWTQGQYLLTTKPGVNAPLLNTGIHFPSQPSGSAFENPAAHKTLDGGQVVPLPVASGGQHVPVCIYGHQHQYQQLPPSPLGAPWPFSSHLSAPPQAAAAYASAVAIVPQPQLRKSDNVDAKDLPVLHHQQNVYNYYSGAAWPPHVQRHQHGQHQQQHLQQQQPQQLQQQQQPLLHPVFCGWLPSPQDTHLPPHSLASPLKPYFGWRAEGQAGVGAEADLQKSAALQGEMTKADEAGLRQRTTTGEAVFTEKPLVESEPAAARDSHLDEGKSQLGEALAGDQLPRRSQNESSPAPQAGSTRKPQAAATGATTQVTHHQTSTKATEPCCGETTDVAEERERAKLATETQTTEERQRFASEIRPLQGTRAAILPGLSATPTVPILSSTDGHGATNR